PSPPGLPRLPWVNTGIDVVEGQLLTITTDPSALVTDFFDLFGGVNANGISPSGFPNGTERDVCNFFEDAPAPGTICYSLIGKIGGTREIGTGELLTEGALGKGAGFVGTSYAQ